MNGRVPILYTNNHSRTRLLAHLHGKLQLSELYRKITVSDFEYFGNFIFLKMINLYACFNVAKCVQLHSINGSLFPTSYFPGNFKKPPIIPISVVSNLLDDPLKTYHHDNNSHISGGKKDTYPYLLTALAHYDCSQAIRFSRCIYAEINDFIKVVECQYL